MLGTFAKWINKLMNSNDIMDLFFVFCIKEFNLMQTKTSACDEETYIHMIYLIKILKFGMLFIGR